MGKLFVLLLIVAGLTNIFADETKEHDFYLKIDFINREKSKDSNSQHHTVIVKNREVTYHYEYNGFPFPSDREKSNRYKLSDSQFREIIEQIKSIHINRSITELKKDKYIGHSVELSLILKLDGKTSESHITGMTSSFRHKDKLIRHKSYVDDVESLISDLSEPQE